MVKSKNNVVTYGLSNKVGDLFVPEIENVDLSKYTGTPDDIIKIITSDDVMAKSVHINISNDNGSE